MNFPQKCQVPQNFADFESQCQERLFPNISRPNCKRIEKNGLKMLHRFCFFKSSQIKMDESKTTDIYFWWDSAAVKLHFWSGKFIYLLTRLTRADFSPRMDFLHFWSNFGQSWLEIQWKEAQSSGRLNSWQSQNTQKGKNMNR